MTQASVGFHCPECLRSGKQQVINSRSMYANPVLTMGLIAVNVLVFLIGQGSGSADRIGRGVNDVWRDYALFGPEIDLSNEWWRIISGGFIHADLLHIGFNMYLLYMLGRQLESVMGNVDFFLLYFGGLVGGSFGALLLTPNALTGGASGAVFGLMGGYIVFLLSRGLGSQIFAGGLGGIGGLVIINVLFSFRGGVSLGGHLGGLVAGSLLAFVLTGANKAIPNQWAQRGVASVIAAGLAGASYWAAGPWSDPLFGTGGV